MHNNMVNNRQLQICHYELKEFRDIADEETKDKLGFQRFKQLNYSTSHWNDISSRDEFYYKITQLLQTLPMQGKFGQGNNPLYNRGGYNNQRQGGYNKRSTTPHQQRPAHMQHNGNMMSVHNQGGRNTSMDQNRMGGMPPHHQMQQPSMPAPTAM